GFGLQPVLAALAAIGLAWSAARLGGRAGRALRAASLALALVTSGAVLGGIVLSALRQEPLRPYRATLDEASAIAGLAGRMCPADVLRADWDLMNYAAGRIPGRTVGGHPVATVDTVARKAELTAAGRDPQRWQALVERYHPTYLLYGAAEQGLPPPA